MSLDPGSPAGELVRPRLAERRGLPVRCFRAGTGVALSLWSLPAEAHVKWFAPYIVGAPPAPIGATLADPWLWTGIALVLVFFVATRAVERSSVGEKILLGMDRMTDPLWRPSTILSAWWASGASARPR